jgi:[acyl-carrier-protein] S-malonyltransferase
MGKALADSDPLARAVFEEADQVLGMRLSSLCFQGPESELTLTANAQPAIVAASIAHLRLLLSRGVRADYVAGHSLGEYSALVAAGSLSLADALKLVRLRGIFMQEAVPPGQGAMAALIGLDLKTVEQICEQAQSYGVCTPANLNAPNQIVISGHRSAVEYASNLATERGRCRVVMLAVSAPFHCELMKPAAIRLAPHLAETRFADLEVPLVTNVDAELIKSGDEAKDALLRQIESPVRWSDSIKRLLDEGVTHFIEVGPGKVLSGLVKQLCRQCHVFNFEDAGSLEQALELLKQ